MTATAVVTAACTWCKTEQPVTSLIRPLENIERIVCRDGDACSDRVRRATPEPVHPAHPEPLADDTVVWQPGREPVSGRSEPRETPSGFPHRLRFLDLTATWTESDGVRFGPFRVVCHDEPGLSVWARAFEAGDYTSRDLERLVRQHNGQEDPVPVMSAVEFVRELSGWKGSACLVRKDGKHYVVSSVNSLYTGPETLVFESDDNGKPDTYQDIAGGRGMSRDEAIADLANLGEDGAS